MEILSLSPALNSASDPDSVRCSPFPPIPMDRTPGSCDAPISFSFYSPSVGTEWEGAGGTVAGTILAARRRPRPPEAEASYRLCRYSRPSSPAALNESRRASTIPNAWTRLRGERNSRSKAQGPTRSHRRRRHAPPLSCHSCAGSTTRGLGIPAPGLVGLLPTSRVECRTCTRDSGPGITGMSCFDPAARFGPAPFS